MTNMTKTRMSQKYDFMYLKFCNHVQQFNFYAIRLNSRHVNIKFTTEFEEDREIPFFNILIKRRRHLVSNSQHHYCHYTERRNKTSIGLFKAKWDSFTPRKYKIQLRKSYPRAYLSLFSHFVTFSEHCVLL